MLINSCLGVKVISDGDPLEIYTEKDGDTELKLATTVSGFLGKQMES